MTAFSSPNDPDYSHEYGYMIADFDEGKLLKASQEITDPPDIVRAAEVKRPKFFPLQLLHGT